MEEMGVCLSINLSPSGTEGGQELLVGVRNSNFIYSITSYQIYFSKRVAVPSTVLSVCYGPVDSCMERVSVRGTLMVGTVLNMRKCILALQRYWQI